MKDTIAIVTGATRGLGYATAIALAARGAHVIAIGRTVGGLEELDDVISDAGGSCTLTPMDLNDDPGLERLGAAIYQRWGHVDLMVHAAAEAAPLSPAEHIAAKDLDKAITANFRIIQRLIRVTQPLLKAAKSPQAVFIADPETEGARFNGAYGASKAAGRALVQSWAAEQARLGPQDLARRTAPDGDCHSRARLSGRGSHETCAMFRCGGADCCQNRRGRRGIGGDAHFLSLIPLLHE